MNFEMINTNERRSQRVKEKFNLQKAADPPSYAGTDMFQERYILTNTVCTEFWSNSAQIEIKSRDAKIMARSYIFKDMIPIVKEIITDTDCDYVRKKALDLLDMMAEGQTS